MEDLNPPATFELILRKYRLVEESEIFSETILISESILSARYQLINSSLPEDVAESIKKFCV